MLKNPILPIIGIVVWASLLSPAIAGNDFTLTSSVLTPDGDLQEGQVYSRSGCNGGNRSPDLKWSAPPAGTKSLAITVYDPDAPTGKGWWHWIVFNLPPTLRTLPEGAGGNNPLALPRNAAQGKNDFGQSGYGGACPPVGDKAHHYVFTVWALYTEQLPLESNASGSVIDVLLRQHTIAIATLTVHYGR